jgi:hypothetical protein
VTGVSSDLAHCFRSNHTEGDRSTELWITLLTLPRQPPQSPRNYYTLDDLPKI